MDARLSDSAIVCRGGTCTARRFLDGSGVSLDAQGSLQNVSVNASDEADLATLSASIPNRQLGVTTAGAVREAGGEVSPKPNSRNSYHCVMSGVTAEVAERLFSPTQPNPNQE